MQQTGRDSKDSKLQENGMAGQADGAGGPRIVVVGGGAGGLELATRLGDRLGKRGTAQIVLVLGVAVAARPLFQPPYLLLISVTSLMIGLCLVRPLSTKVKRTSITFASVFAV